jgi:hypothetical protein
VPLNRSHSSAALEVFAGSRSVGGWQTALHPSDDRIILRSMSLRLIASRIRQGGRLWTAALCTTFALTASAVPCLCACLGHATETDHAGSPGCHHPGSENGDADHDAGQGHCPPTLACASDQAPAVSAQPGPTVPRASLVLFIVSATNAAPSQPAVLVKTRVSPDRGPPIPVPRFNILRL